MKFRFFLFFTLCSVNLLVGRSSNLYVDEVRSLSELPMEKLIRLKSSLTSDGSNEDEDTRLGRTYAMHLPIAIPLKRSGRKPIRRHGHHDDKGKDTKISKIFQLAVTALSFLAFGGYLITLIITAIRRNSMNNNNNNGNVILLSNLQSLQKYKRPKRNVFIYDPMENDFETDKLYQGMVMLSRGYALYHQ